jgi:hypothetical protein
MLSPYTNNLLTFSKRATKSDLKDTILHRLALIEFSPVLSPNWLDDRFVISVLRLTFSHSWIRSLDCWFGMCILWLIGMLESPVVCVLGWLLRLPACMQNLLGYPTWAL